MKRYIHIIRYATACAVLMAATALASAQDTKSLRQHFEEAQHNYVIGRVEQAASQLQPLLKQMSGSLQQSAYHLMTLCYLSQDKDTEARYYAEQLLSLNPYFTPLSSDPLRLVDMINEVKASRTATITTASSQAEGIEESPVPVTLITEEMIYNSGARNIKELLLAYVPSMTDVDSNDDMTVAMRGIFSVSQDKMLVLINGHRLNSYATNSGNLDYSISLDKVKQIEVLRGPASSLYGGVALTAVINIITKNGADVDGLLLRGGVGNYGQLRGDLLFGKSFYDVNVLAWASLYQAGGQKEYLDLSETGIRRGGGDYYIGRIKGNPTYDIGVNINWKGLKLYYSSKYSNVVNPLTIANTHSPYNYDYYPSYRGQSLGKSTKSHHAEVAYSATFGKLTIGANFTYDNSDLMHYQVLTDSAFDYLASVLGLSSRMDVLLENYRNIYRYHDAQELNLAGQLKLDFNYINTDSHKGTVSGGFQFSRFELEDTKYEVNGTLSYLGTDGTIKEIPNSSIFIQNTEQFSEMGAGSEKNGNAYLQLKHRWNRWILNVGLRYDFIYHYDNHTIREFSPRAALIYVAPKWWAKASYARSFVDAPYFFRKTNDILKFVAISSGELAQDTAYLSSMRGLKDLESEIIHSWQASVGSNKLIPGFAVDFNVFYNFAKNLLYPNGLIRMNAGSTKMLGVELSANYVRNRLSAHFSMSWLHQIETDISGRWHSTNRQLNVPKFSANLVAGYRFTKNFRAHGHLCFYGSQDSYQIDLSTGTTLYSEATIPARAILDVGASYDIKPVTFSFNVHNLFNTTYYQGGLSARALRQQGLWFIGDVSVKF